MNLLRAKTELRGGAQRRRTTTRLPQVVDASRDPTAFRPWRPSPRIRLLLLLNVMAASFYVIWWLTPGHVGIPTLFWLLAAAEGFSLVHQLGLWWAIWATRVDPPPAATREYTIDVLIPTMGEPLDVLMKTIGAAVAMDLPHVTYVLDDAGREEVELLARKLGAEYIARPPGRRRGAKAGNLNYALARTSGELFAIFDADHVPRPDFLRRIVGYFENDDLAFVQTPQYYGNSSTNRVARGAFQQQAIFYGPICRGKNGLDSAFCCGTNVLFRREAIVEVGGFNEKSVVEDFVTSMRIHRKGWSSVYFPYVLAEGLGPASLRTYFRQQFRWARGSVGAFFSLEPFKPGFTLGQRVQYLLATTFYLIGSVTAIYVALPIMYLLFGWSAFSASSATFVFFYAPYLLLALMTIRWGLGGQLRAEHLQYTFGTFPVYAVASLAALLHIPARFRVTSKSAATRRVPPVLAWITIAAFALTGVALVIGLSTQRASPRTFTNVSWAVINLFLMSAIVRVAWRELFRKDRPETWEPIPTRTGRGRVLLPVAGGQDVRVRDEVLTHEDALVLPEHAVPPVRGRSSAWTVRRTLLYVGALTACGLALRLALINAQSLRLDESISLKQVTDFSLVGLWKYMVEGNVHIPLYHSILYFWVRVVGTAEWQLRLPSVIFGTAAIPLLFVVARRIASVRTALFATAIGAASPFLIWHSDEARMYPLLLFLTLASMYLLFTALDRGGFWWWAAYAVVTGVSLYSHYFALLMPPVHLAYLLINRVPRRKLLAWFGAMTVVGLMFLPWVIALYSLRIQAAGLSSLTNGIRIAPPTYTLFGIVYGLVAFFLVFIVGYGQATGHGAGPLGVLSYMVAGSWPVIALLSVTSRQAGKILRSRTFQFLATWLVLTVGLVFAMAAVKPGLFVQKYLIVAAPALFILLGGALGLLVRPRPIILGLVVLAFGSLAVVENVQVSNPVREDFRTAAHVIERDAHPGDIVVVMPSFYDTPVEYYLRGRIPVIPIMSGGSTPADVIGRTLPAIAQAHQGHTMWLILPYVSKFDPSGEIRTFLNRTETLRARYILGGDMEMRRYEIPRFAHAP